jgi:hypothetical protein
MSDPGGLQTLCETSIVPMALGICSILPGAEAPGY